jgi:hypothetical protein
MHRLVIGVALAAGCTQTVTDDAISVCQPLCRCSDVPLPGEQRECTSQCTARFEMHPLGEACVSCVVGHADRCTGLVEDCVPICTQPGLAPAAREGRRPWLGPDRGLELGR